MSELLNQRYLIKDILGQGSFGETYLAFDQKNNQTCAVKKLVLDKAQDWKSLELFEREAQTLKELKHVSIPNFIDFFTSETKGLPEMFLVQEYIEGQNLEVLVNQGKRFQPTDLKEMAIQLAKVLVYLHSFSPPIIHRDIKPSNILLTSDGRIHLIDFGAVYNPVSTNGSTIVGTFGYMPIEQFEGRVSPASDIYALGATLLFLSTGKSPNEWPKNGLTYNLKELNLPSSFKKVLDKMLAPDASQRYPSGKELLMDLVKTPFSFGDFKLGKFKPQPKVYITVISLILGALGLFIWANSSRTPDRAKTRDHQILKPTQSHHKTKVKKVLVNVKEALPPWKRLKLDGWAASRSSIIFFDSKNHLWTMDTSYIRKYKAPHYFQADEWNSSTLSKAGYFKDMLLLPSGDLVALKGKSLYVYKNKQWQKMPLSLDISHIYDIALYQGKLLVVLSNLVLQWDEKREHFTQLASFEKKLNYPKLITSDRQLWVKSGNTFWEYKKNQFEKSLYVNYSDFNIVGNTSITPEGHLVMGARNEVLEYNPKTQALKRKNKISFSQVIHPLNNNDLLVGSKYSGLFYLKGNKSYPFDWRRGFISDKVKAITISKEGLLALSTDKGILIAPKTDALKHIEGIAKRQFLPGKWLGLNCKKASQDIKKPAFGVQKTNYNGKSYLFLNGQLACPDKLGFAQSPQNFVLYQDPIGKEQTLLYLHNSNENIIPVPEKLSQLYLSPQNKLYFSGKYSYKTHDANLYIYGESNKGWEKLLQGSDYLLDHTLTFAQDGDRLLAGSHSYKYKKFPLFAIQNNTVKPFSWPMSSSAPRVSAILSLGKGDLAIGTNRGLYLYRQGEVVLIGKEALTGGTIQSLVRNAGKIWMSYGYSGRGLSIYDLKTKKISHITSRQGLWMEHIDKFGFDGNNRIWLKSVHDGIAYHDIEPLLKSAVHDTLSIKD